MKTLKKLEHDISRRVGRAIHDFGMIEENDRVLVALSGGKDSWALLHVLHLLRRRAPIPFEVVAVTVHPGFPQFSVQAIEDFCRSAGYAHFVEHTNMREILEDMYQPEDVYCPFCARLRRGVLYTVARREGFNKIALGHHADDLIETLLMAEFFTGEIKSMPPLLRADDGVNVVIRPLCYAFEKEIAQFAEMMKFPLLECACPMSGRLDLQRHRMKKLLNGLEEEHPGIKANLLSCLGRVRLNHLMLNRPANPQKILVKPQE
jgi:tRNA 2-thiocytidine biosynthesis protein TtcA